MTYLTFSKQMTLLWYLGAIFNFNDYKGDGTMSQNVSLVCN